jgi:hypothetical protein
LTVNLIFLLCILLVRQKKRNLLEKFRESGLSDSRLAELQRQLEGDAAKHREKEAAREAEKRAEKQQRREKLQARRDARAASE